MTQITQNCQPDPVPDQTAFLERQTEHLESLIPYLGGSRRAQTRARAAYLRQELALRRAGR